MNMERIKIEFISDGMIDNDIKGRVENWCAMNHTNEIPDGTKEQLYRRDISAFRSLDINYNDMTMPYNKLSKLADIIQDYGRVIITPQNTVSVLRN